MTTTSELPETLPSGPGLGPGIGPGPGPDTTGAHTDTDTDIGTDTAAEAAGSATGTAASTAGPIRVCGYEELIAGRGAAVLLPGGGQAAVFRTLGGGLHAVGNLDPATGAQVISRGLTGSRDGAATIASPLLKHVYELATGRCVDGPAGAEPALALTTFPVFCDDGVVYVLDDPALHDRATHHDGGRP